MEGFLFLETFGSAVCTTSAVHFAYLFVLFLCQWDIYFTVVTYHHILFCKLAVDRHRYSDRLIRIYVSSITNINDVFDFAVTCQAVLNLGVCRNAVRT